MCTFHLSKVSGSISNMAECALRYSSAIMALSFMTSPRFPVRVSLPVPFVSEVSIKRISPPVGVQARPVTTPATSLSLYLSFSCEGPKIFSTSAGVMAVVNFSSSASCLARFRTTLPMRFSRLRTPDSLVYSSISLTMMSSPILIWLSFKPFSDSCLGRR